MIDQILMFALQWFPTMIWTILCIVGIHYGYKETKECREDLTNIERDKNSLKFIVARSNRINALRNIKVQISFLGVAVLITYFKLQEPNPWVVDSEESFIRALVAPIFFIFSEYLLISNLMEINNMRKLIKEKVDKRKIELEKE